MQKKRTCQAGLSLGVMLLRQRNIFREITHNVARREGVLRLAATHALYCATRFAVRGKKKSVDKRFEILSQGSSFERDPFVVPVL